MPIVKKDHIEEGDLVDSTQLNDIYSDIANATGLIDKDNIGDEAVHRQHHNAVATAPKIWNVSDSGDHLLYVGSTNWATYLTLSPAVTLYPYDVLRAHACVFLGRFAYNQEKPNTNDEIRWRFKFTFTTNLSVDYERLSPVYRFATKSIRSNTGMESIREYNDIKFSHMIVETDENRIGFKLKQIELQYMAEEGVSFTILGGNTTGILFRG